MRPAWTRSRCTWTGWTDARRSRPGHRTAGLTLEHARDGFARLGAAWERGRTELDLAEALAAVGRSDDARAAMEASAADLERVGALIEIERLRSLRAGLG